MNWRETSARIRAVREPRWFPVTLLVASCMPGLVAIGAMASDLFLNTTLLGSNPVKESEHFLG
mgnify:FL=1